MLDILLTKLGETHEALQKEIDEEEKFYEKQKQIVNRDVQFYTELRNNEKADHYVRLFAGKIAAIECNIMALRSSHVALVALVEMLNISTQMSISIIANKLARIEKTADTGLDSEKLNALQKELTRLKEIAEKDKPYIDNLKQGIENKKHWLKENR